jgi:hypothetical protein
MAVVKTNFLNSRFDGDNRWIDRARDMEVAPIVLHNYVNAKTLKSFVTLQQQNGDCAELWGYIHQASVYRISCHKVKHSEIKQRRLY